MFLGGTAVEVAVVRASKMLLAVLLLYTVSRQDNVGRQLRTYVVERVF